MLKRFFKTHGWRYIPGFFLMIACAWIQTRSPLALGEAVQLAAGADWNAFIQKALSILWIALGVFATRFGWRWFVVRTSREMEVYLRDQLYAHLVNLPVGFYGKSRSGDLMAYAINDVNAVRMMFGMVVAQVVNSVSSILFSVGEMTGGIHAGLTLYSLLPVPLAILAVLVLGRQIQARARRAQELFSQLSGHVQENIGGMRVIKAFAQEDDQYGEYEQESLEKRRANERLYFTGALIDPVIKTVFAVSYTVGLIYGGQLVLDGAMSLAQYVAFNSYLAMIVTPVVAVGRISNNLQRGLASYKRLKTLMDEPETPAFDKEDDGVPVDPGIEARNLSWKYPDASDYALLNVSFSLRPGGMLGVVGPTGGGKSTLLSLLTKLISPARGELFFGGRDACDIPAVSLRASMGFVPQDGFLFDESIRENVRFFSGATDGEVLCALSDAGMALDLKGMPEGVNTPCGERGNHLSGGQRQRVALARALVRRPQTLLLDDTLSAVDARTEEAILKNLKERLTGATCVVVAHRLSAVRHADEILYVDKGRVTERGTHEALLALRGGYYHMYELQNRKEDGRDGE